MGFEPKEVRNVDSVGAGGGAWSCGPGSSGRSLSLSHDPHLLPRGLPAGAADKAREPGDLRVARSRPRRRLPRLPRLPAGRRPSWALAPKGQDAPAPFATATSVAEATGS